MLVGLGHHKSVHSTLYNVNIFFLFFFKYSFNLDLYFKDLQVYKYSVQLYWSNIICINFEKVIQLLNIFS